MSDSISFLNKKINRPTNNMNENLNIYQNMNPNQILRDQGKI